MVPFFASFFEGVSDASARQISASSYEIGSK